MGVETQQRFVLEVQEGTKLLSADQMERLRTQFARFLGVPREQVTVLAGARLHVVDVALPPLRPAEPEV